MNQGKVVPTTSTDGAKPPNRRLPSSQNLFSATPTSRVNQRQIHHGESLEQVILRKDDELSSKKSTYIFVLVLGSVLIAAGSAMTWWGTQSEVKDLLIIGPGSIIIGFGLIVIGIIFGVRTLYFRRRAKRIKEGLEDRNTDEDLTRLEKEYYVPGVGGKHNREETPPGGDVLYGADDRERARRASIMTQSTKTSGVITPPIPLSADGVNPRSAHCYTDDIKELSAPIVSFPRTMADQDVTGPTYQVTMESPAHKADKQKAHLPTIDDEDETQNQDKDTTHIPADDGDDKLNKQLKTRPDSGYIADTPDTLDSVLED